MEIDLETEEFGHSASPWYLSKLIKSRTYMPALEGGSTDSRCKVSALKRV
jgi:hypothetical protein